MTTLTNSHISDPLSIDLNRPGALPSGAVFVWLPTLDDLCIYWNNAPTRLLFAARCQGMLGPHFLRPGEWVFAETASALVRAVTRWDSLGIRCQWYDWLGDTEASITHAEWVEDLVQERRLRIKAGTWSEDEQEKYVAEISVEGYWVLANLPAAMTMEDWFPAFTSEDITDATLDVASVAESMQAMTYEAWRAAGVHDILFMSAEEMDEEVTYWQEQRRTGQPYYGMEFEEMGNV